MLKNLSPYLSLILLLAVISGCASSDMQRKNSRDSRGPGENSGPPVFSDMDLNNDGYVNESEFKGPDDLFSKLDSNSDGLITEEEFEELPEPEGRRPPGRRG